jgi:hypothetical protein
MMLAATASVSSTQTGMRRAAQIMTTPVANAQTPTPSAKPSGPDLPGSTSTTPIPYRPMTTARKPPLRATIARWAGDPSLVHAS